MPKVLTQYMKNVIKSTGYAVSDIAHSMAPNFFEMKEDAKSVASDLYRQIKEFGGPSEGGKSAIGKAKDTVNDVFKNMLEDISTGKFYNKERSEALMTDVVKSMGMDFDFDMDFGDDWGTGEDFDFEDTSDENIIKADRRNTRDTIVAIDTVGARLSNEIGQATAATGKMIATANLNATKALYSLNQKGFNQVTEGIIGLNNSITSLGAFMAPLSEHFQNSTKFFAETTKTLYDINNNLTAILKNTTPSPEAANNKYRQNKNTLASLMSGDAFSFSSYKDMVKDNIKEAMGMYSMLDDFLGPLLKSGKGGKNFSPTGMLYTAALKKLIPEAFESAVKSLDENLGHYIAGAIAKAGAKNQNNYGLSGILASIFLPKREYNDKLSTGDYIKGKVAWDGKSRKALVEVIPTYLSKILASIQGSDEEYRFDYDRGKFVSYKDIKSAKDKHLLESARSAFGQYYSDTKSIIGDKKDKKSKALQQELDEFVLAAFKRGADYWDINKKELFDYKKGNNLSEEDKKHNKEVEKLRKSLGLSGSNADELIDILRATLLENDKSGNTRIKRKYARTIGQVEMARNKMANTMREWSASGDNIYNALYNNSFAMGRTHGEEMKLAQGMTDFGKLNASYQQNVLKYLDGITRLIAGLYGGTIGKRKKGKGGVKLTGSAEDIINSVTGNSTINSAETSREESTQNALANSTMKPQEDDENISEEERERRRNESLNNAKSEVEGFLGNKLKGAPGGLVRLFETPFRAATEFFNKINDGFNQFLWGNPDGSKEGLFDSLIKKADESLDKIFANGIGKTIKDKLVSYKNYLFGQDDNPGFFHNFGTNTLNSLKSVGKWFTGAARGVFNTPIKDPKYATDNGKAAGGRRVTKSGVVTVSEGELIVPSELNPFYHNKTDKKKQVQTEDEIYRNYLGSFADGGTVGGETLTQHIDPNHLELINKRLGDREPLQNEGMTIEGHRYVYKNGQWLDATGSLTDRAVKAGKSVVDAIHKAADETLSHLRGNQSEEDKARSNVKKAFLKAVGKEVGEEAKANNGAIGAGAAIGAIGSFLTGGLIGPIGGALVGSAAGLIIKSEKVQNLLFGKIDEKTGERSGGLVSKELSNFLQKHGVNIGKGAALGTIGGLFMGSPVLGLILGSAAGFATSSEDFQDKLFGSKVKDENGNYTGERIDNGMISKALQEHIKKTAPKGIAGGLIGYLTTPIGSSPVLNLILGASVGFATSSERFKNFMFGEEDENGKRTGGLVQKIRERIIWNIDSIAHNTWNNLKGLGKNITIAVTDGIKNITARLGRYFAGRIGGNKLGNAILNVLGFGANAGTGLLGGALGFVSRRLTNRALKKGRDVYDRRLGRNMTAEERNRLRGYESVADAAKNGDTYSKIDAALSEIRSKEDVDLFNEGLKDLINPRRNTYRNQEKALTFAESKFGRYLTKDNKKAILNYVKKGGDVDAVLDIYANSNASENDKANYAAYRNQLRDYLINARENYQNAGNVTASKGMKHVTSALRNAGINVGELNKYELSNMQSLLKTEAKQFDEKVIAQDTNSKIGEGNKILEKINSGIDSITDSIGDIAAYLRGSGHVAYGDRAGSILALAGEGEYQKGADGKYYKEKLGTKVRATKIGAWLHNRRRKRKTGETSEEYLKRIRIEAEDENILDNLSDEEILKLAKEYNIEEPDQSAFGNIYDITHRKKSTVSAGEVIIPVGKNAAKTVKLNEAKSGLILQSLLHTGMRDIATASKYVDHMANTVDRMNGIDKANISTNFGTNATGDFNKVKPGDKDAKETFTIFDALGNPHQFVKNNQGELTKQTNDRETDASVKEMKEVTDAIKRIGGPGLAGGLGLAGITAAAAAKEASALEAFLAKFGGYKADDDSNTAQDKKSSNGGGIAQGIIGGAVGAKVAGVFKKIFGGSKAIDAANDTTKILDKSEDAAKAIDKGTDATKAIDAASDAAKITDTTGDVAKATDAVNDANNGIIDITKLNKTTKVVDNTQDLSKGIDNVTDITNWSKNSGKTGDFLYDSLGNYKGGYHTEINKVIDDLTDETKLTDSTGDVMNFLKTSYWNKKVGIGNLDLKTGLKNFGDKAVDAGKFVYNKGKTIAKKGLDFLKKYAEPISKFLCMVAAVATFASFIYKRIKKPHNIYDEFIAPGIAETQNNTDYRYEFYSLSDFRTYCGDPNAKMWFENHPFGAYIGINGGCFFPYQILSKAAETLAKNNKAIDAGIVPDFNCGAQGSGNIDYTDQKLTNDTFEAIEYEYYDYTYISDISGKLTSSIDTWKQMIKGGKNMGGDYPATRFVQHIQSFTTKDFEYHKSYVAMDTTGTVDKLKERLGEWIADTMSGLQGTILGGLVVASIEAAEIALNLTGGFVVYAGKKVVDAFERSKNTSVTGVFKSYIYPFNILQGTIDGFIDFNDNFWNGFSLQKPYEKLPSNVKFSYATHEGYEEQHIADLQLADRRDQAANENTELGKKYKEYSNMISGFYNGIIDDINTINIVSPSDDGYGSNFWKQEYTNKFDAEKSEAITQLYSLNEDPGVLINRIYENNKDGMRINDPTGFDESVNAAIIDRASYLKSNYDKYASAKPQDKYKPTILTQHQAGKIETVYKWSDGTVTTSAEKYAKEEGKFDQSTGVYRWPDGKVTKKQQYSDNSYYEAISGSGSGLKRYSGKGSASTGEFISQYDPAYANKKIFGKPFSDAGCGPSVAAMAASSFGLDLPMEKAISESSGFQNNNGVEADYFSSVLGKKGIDTNYLEKSGDIYSNLQAGNPVVMLGNDPRNNNKSLSPWGPDNHYVLGRGITKDGNIVVEDPEMKGPTVYDPSILNNTKLGISTEYSAGKSGISKKISKYFKNKFGKKKSGAGTRDEIKEQVYAWLTNNGYSPAAAAGVMGNIEQECSFDNTNLTNEGGGVIAAGLFQWHDYAPYKTNPKNYSAMGRFGGLVKLADQNDRDWTDVEMQLKFMNTELHGDVATWFDPKNSSDSGIRKAGKGGYYNSKGNWQNGTFNNAGLNYDTDGITVSQFLALDDPAKAAQYFEAAFERAGKPNMKRRMEAAVQYYNQFSGKHFDYDPSKYAVALAGTTTASEALASAATANIDTSNMNASQKVSTFMNYIFDGVLPGSTQFADEGSGLTGAEANAALYGDATNVQQALVNYALSKQDSEHYSQDYRETTRDGIYQSDCSSFAQRAYKTVTNLDIGGNTESQYNKSENKSGPMNTVYKSKGARKNALDVMQPGDLVYWYTKGHRGGRADDVSHVEMYAGDGKLIGQDASGPNRTGPHVKSFSSFRTSPDKFLMVTRLKKDILDKLNGQYNLEKSMADGTWQKKSEEDSKKAYITGTRGTAPNFTYIWSDGKETTSPTREDQATISHAKYLGFYGGSHHWDDGYTSTAYNRPNWSASGSGVDGPQLVTMEKILKKYKKSPSKSKVSTPAVKVETTPIGGSGSTLKPISIDKFNTTNHVVHSSKPAYSGGASGNKQSESVYKAFFDAVVSVLKDIKTNTSVTPALASSMVAFASRTQSELSTNTNIIKGHLQASIQEKYDTETETAINNLSTQLAAIIEG